MHFINLWARRFLVVKFFFPHSVSMSLFLRRYSINYHLHSGFLHINFNVPKSSVNITTKLLRKYCGLIPIFVEILIPLHKLSVTPDFCPLTWTNFLTTFSFSCPSGHPSHPSVRPVYIYSSPVFLPPSFYPPSHFSLPFLHTSFISYFLPFPFPIISPLPSSSSFLVFFSIFFIQFRTWHFVQVILLSFLHFFPFYPSSFLLFLSHSMSSNPSCSSLNSFLFL